MLLIDALKLSAETNKILLLTSDQDDCVVMVHPKRSTVFAGFTKDVLPAFNEYKPQSLREYPVLDTVGTLAFRNNYSSDDYQVADSWAYTKK